MKRLIYAIFLSLCAVMTVQANDYLEHSEHYTVMNMGNGVYRFTVPIWVFGGWNMMLRAKNCKVLVLCTLLLLAAGCKDKNVPVNPYVTTC